MGCACQIEETLERMEDGRLNILARGTRPFRLLERQDDLPYPAAVVEFLDEPAEETDAEAARAARELYRELVEQATDQKLSDEELGELDAYGMAATVEFGSDAKQELLELRSENARLRLLALLLQAAIKRLEVVERAQTRALLERQGPLRLVARVATRGADRLGWGHAAHMRRWQTCCAVCSTNSARLRNTAAARPSCRRSSRFRFRRAGE